MISKISKGLFFICLMAGSVACDGDNGADGTNGMDGTDGMDGMDGTDGTAAGDFQFRTDSASAYTQVDRMGMPAINTAVITSKDVYNGDSPTGDVAGASIYPAEITANVTALHTALDDDLTTALGATSFCAAADCVATTAPLVIPDTIRIDRTAAAGFPNGRLLPDPVMDVTLALVLLDLSTPGTCGGVDCTVGTLAGLPLNPAANDVPFLGFFPYLAPPN